MHPSDLPPDLVARLTARRGRRHVFDDLAPARTALVVIDMQAAFTDAASPLCVPAATGVVPAITRMADGLRAGGNGGLGPVGLSAVEPRLGHVL